MDSPVCWLIKLVIAAILLVKFFRAAYKELEERKTECEKEWIEYEESFKNKEDI